MFCQYPCAIDRARGGDSAKTLTRLCCAADHNPRDPPNCRCNMMQHVQKRPSAQSTSFRRPILKSFHLVHTTRAATPSNCNFARAGSPDAGNLGLLRPFVLQQPVVPAKVHILQRSPTLRRVTFEWCKHAVIVARRIGCIRRANNLHYLVVYVWFELECSPSGLALSCHLVGRCCCVSVRVFFRRTRCIAFVCRADVVALVTIFSFSRHAQGPSCARLNRHSRDRP